MFPAEHFLLFLDKAHNERFFHFRIYTYLSLFLSSHLLPKIMNLKYNNICIIIWYQYLYEPFLMLNGYRKEKKLLDNSPIIYNSSKCVCVTKMIWKRSKSQNYKIKLYFRIFAMWIMRHNVWIRLPVWLLKTFYKFKYKVNISL